MREKLAETLLTDHELVRFLAQGSERQAISYLFHSYARPLYIIIKNIVKNHETAEELLQDVFVKIWQNLSSYSPDEGRFYCWISAISRNHAISYLRSASAKKLQHLVYDTAAVDAAFFSDVFHMPTDTIGVQGFLNVLPSDQQDMIHTFYFSGFTQAEIAEKYNMPLGTVKTRLRTAMNNLRKVFLPVSKAV